MLLLLLLPMTLMAVIATPAIQRLRVLTLQQLPSAPRACRELSARVRSAPVWQPNSCLKRVCF
jgi:hypothetical protein